MRCPSCGTSLPSRSRFCLSCGAAVDARDGLKTATLLFTDVTGSTALGERMDAEAYRGVLGRYFEVARDAVEAHGGRVEKFVGDAVVAVFGVPEVHEDDALRAVRAADDLRRAVGELSDELARTHGMTLVIRTGVNTGPVVVGSARAGGSFATGDAVNTAARLEQAADPGEILLGVETWRLVSDAVDAEPVTPLLVRGKSAPVAAYRLLAVHSDRAGRSRRFGDPLVGRAAEVEVLAAALDRVVADERGRLVTVIGPPGMGKTRLLREFDEHVRDRVLVAGGRCLSYGDGITYFPVIGLLRSALGLRGSEPEGVVRRAVEDALPGAEDAPAVADLLLPLLGGSGTPGDQTETEWAIQHLLQQLARARPLVIVVDDLHWADATVLDLLRHAVEQADAPLLVVGAARPDLLDHHPAWGVADETATVLDLPPFDLPQVAARVADILGGAPPPGAVESVSAWSGGNPLFVEEIVTHLLEEGQLQAADGAWTLAGDLDRVAVPPSVAAVLHARLDRLPSGERELLERAAIVGLEFTDDDADVLTDPEHRPMVATTLGALARRDLLHQRTPTSWAFRHILIRDVAYDALPKAQRAELHERYATAVSDAIIGEDTGAERLAFVAHHLERALHLRGELAPRDALAELTQRTGAAIDAAILDARRRDDPQGSLRLLERGLSLDLAPRQHREWLHLRLQLGREYSRFDDEPTDVLVAKLLETVDDTVTETERLGLEAEQLLYRLQLSEELDPQLAIAAGERLASMARADGSVRLLELSVWSRILGYATTNRWAALGPAIDDLFALGHPAAIRLAHLTRSTIVLYDDSPLPRLAEITRGSGWRAVSDHDRMWDRFFDAFVLAARDHPDATTALDQVMADASNVPAQSLNPNVAMAYQLIGQHERSVVHLGRAVAMYEDLGDPAHGSTYQAMRVCELLELGTSADEVAPLLEQARGWTSPYDVVSVAQVHQADSVLAARAGDLDAARRSADLAFGALADCQDLWNEANAWRRTSEWARLAGDRDAERRMLTEARDRYRRKEIAFWTRVCEERLAEL